jgi:hypothetical protein
VPKLDCFSPLFHKRQNDQMNEVHAFAVAICLSGLCCYYYLAGHQKGRTDGRTDGRSLTTDMLIVVVPAAADSDAVSGGGK